MNPRLGPEKLGTNRDLAISTRDGAGAVDAGHSAAEGACVNFDSLTVKRLRVPGSEVRDSHDHGSWGARGHLPETCRNRA